MTDWWDQAFRETEAETRELMRAALATAFKPKTPKTPDRWRIVRQADGRLLRVADVNGTTVVDVDAREPE